MCNLSKLLGLHGDFLITPTSFTGVLWQHSRADQQIYIERIQPGGTDLGRLWEIDDLVDRLEAGAIDLPEGERVLAAILSGPGFYRPWQTAIAWMVIGGAFSALLSASSQDVAVSAGLALLIFLLTHRAAKSPRFTGLVEILAPFVAAVGASAAAACGAVINVPFVILSAVIIFVPGLAFTTALSEISSRNLISGTSRLVDAAMILFKLSFGAALGLSIANLLGAGQFRAAGLPPR